MMPQRAVDMVVYGTVGSAGISVADAVSANNPQATLAACLASVAGALAIWMRYRYQVKADLLVHDQLVKNLREELVRSTTTSEFLKERVVTVTKQCVRLRQRLQDSQVECVAGRCPFAFDGKARCHNQPEPLLPGEAPGDTQEPDIDAI
jgi:hypothetical protein